MSSIADDFVQAEQADKPVDVKSIDVKPLDSISVLANTSVTLSNMQKANARNLLNKHIQGLCDSSSQVSIHLLGMNLIKE